MSHHIEKTGQIDAPIALVYGVVSDVEQYPEFLPGVQQVTRLEGDIVEMTVSLGPVELSWKSQAILKPTEWIDIDLVEGPFRRMDVRWEFADRGDTTLVRYTTDFELSLWLPGLRRIVAAAIRANADATMAAFRRRILSLVGAPRA